MPRRPSSPCTVPGCAALVDRPGRCPDHRREADREVKARQPWRDYGSGWPALAAVVLAEEPTCRACRAAPSTEADHVIPVRDAPWLRLERSNVQGLCKPCHSSKTARENRLGGDPSTK